MSSNKWCTTVDGKEINLFDPDPSLFTVDCIANALARIVRFAGHWERPVSVARHSMRVAERLRSGGYDIETQLQGLFHDAAEAFTTDIPSPLKKLLHISEPGGDGFCGYYMFEDVLLSQIFGVLEIECPLRTEVHKMDKCSTYQECDWVRGEGPDLYRGLSTDPDTVAEGFKRRAEVLFYERAHTNDISAGAGK